LLAPRKGSDLAGIITDPAKRPGSGALVSSVADLDHVTENPDFFPSPFSTILEKK
jgi:hypothetical protein